MRRALLFAILLLPTFALTQAKRPMTFDDLMAMKRVSDPQPSPDGKWVLFSVQGVDLAANKKVTHLWIVDSEGKNESRKVTFSDKGESRGRFSPDGKQVAFTSARDGGKSQVWLAPFDSAAGALGEATKLTNVSTEADGGMWSPDGKRLVYLSEVYPQCGADDACNAQQDEIAGKSKVKAMLFTHLLYRHWNTYLNAKRSHLFVADFDGHKTLSNIRDLTPASVVGDHEVPTFSLGGPDDYWWSADSKEVAYVADLDPVPAISTSKQIYTVQVDDPTAKATKISESKGGNYTPRYSPDGKWIAFRSQERAGYESDRFRLALYNREKKTVSYPQSDFDHWINEIAWQKERLFFTADVQGGVLLYVTDAQRKWQPELKSDTGPKMRNEGGVSGGLLERADIVSGPDSGIDLYGTIMSGQKPPEIVRWGIEGFDDSIIVSQSPAETRRLNEEMARSLKIATYLTKLNDTRLSKLRLREMTDFWFPSKDGTKVQGFLVKPPNFDEHKKYPVKFLIHGGPQGAWGDAWSYRWNAELFAANGYVVVMINPRGSTGYGQKFIDEINGDWGGKPFDDLMAGLDYAEQHYPFIDKSRECALGASYGGYMANWILGHTNRFACIVSHDGMFNPTNAYGATEELWFNEWEFKGKPWDYFDKPASEDPYRKWSPQLAAKNFKTPTLVVHGQLDYRLDVSEGFNLFTTLQRQGVPSEMLYFPDEGHWVLKPQNSQLWYKTVNDWCDKWTHTNAYAAK